MINVRCIFVETTVPVRIRPRMVTLLVNGHFLSVLSLVLPCHLPSIHTNVAALDGSLWCPETQTNIFVVSATAFSNLLRLCDCALVVEEDVWLLLVSTLTLDCQLCRHDCVGEQSIVMATVCSTVQCSLESPPNCVRECVLAS